MKKVLFVCSANKDRSRTADDLFSEQYPNLLIRSGGTNHKACRKEGTTLLTEDMVAWADLVIAMEPKHRQLINDHTAGKYNHKITVLHIPDVYKYYSAELIQILKEKAEPHLMKA